ncbi:MAG: SDR family oxidoreductase [Actinomycetota bacterium]
MAEGPWLVIGATGLVGSNLIRTLTEHGVTVIGTARHPLDGEIALDVTDGQQLNDCLRSVAPKVVVDAAGATAVDRCEEEPAWARAVNEVAPRAIADLLPDASTLVYLSTDYVFDGTGGPYREDAPTGPVNEYGRSKLAGEDAVAAHGRALVVRTTVVYGREVRDPGKNSLYQLDRALRAGEAFRASIDEVGTPTYAADLADAIVGLVESGSLGTFHVGGADLVSRFEYAQTAADVLGLDAGLIEPVESARLDRPAARPLKHGLICEAAEAVLGRPMVGVREGVGRAGEELGW